MKLTVRLQPNASRSECRGKTDDGAYRIRVQAPPVEGAANKELVKFLSKVLRVPKSHISIIRGETSRNKLLHIDGDERELLSRLENLG